MRNYPNRRDFMMNIGLLTLPAIAGCSQRMTEKRVIIDKRKVMLSLLDEGASQEYIPAAFFLHFEEIYHQGQGAIEKHLEYFRYTDMDFVKIQYEKTFPRLTEIEKPEDWLKMPLYREDFYEPQIKVVEGLVKAAKKEALVLVTLYSPFMCAGHTVGEENLERHILDNPEKVKQGMEIITESVTGFVKSCIKAGVDGFYASTQGGESTRFDEQGPFLECIKPYDLAIMEEINRSCIFNILHVCDYSGPYNDLTPFLDYPGDVVNCSLMIDSEEISPKKASEIFGRPFMGGLERKGTLATGSREQIIAKVEEVLRKAPDRFVLGADCTVPWDTDWNNLRTAIDTAHSWKR